MRRDLEDWLRGKTIPQPVVQRPGGVLHLNLPVVQAIPSPFSSDASLPTVVRPPVEAEKREEPISLPPLPPEELSSIPDLLPREVEELSFEEVEISADAPSPEGLRSEVSAFFEESNELTEDPLEELFDDEPPAYPLETEDAQTLFEGDRTEFDGEENSPTQEEEIVDDDDSRPYNEANDDKEVQAKRVQESEASRLTEQLRRLGEMRRLASASRRRFDIGNRKRRFFTYCIILILVVGTLFAALRHRERNSYESLMSQADGLYAERRYEESLTFYKEAFSRYPERLEPALGTAHASEHLGRIEEAIDAYTAALERLPAEQQPARSKTLYEIGRLCALLKIWDKAQKSFELAMEADTANYAAHFALGNALEEQGKMKDAAVAYKRALDLSPSSDAAQRAIKRVSLALPTQEPDFAAIDAEKYKKAVSVGSVALGLKRYDKASQYFAEALALDSSDAEIWVGFGEARQGLGDLSGAATSFRRAIERKPGHTEAQAKLNAVEEVRKKKNAPQRGTDSSKPGTPRRRRTSWLPHAPLNLDLFKKPSRDDLHVLAVPVGGIGSSQTLADAGNRTPGLNMKTNLND